MGFMHSFFSKCRTKFVKHSFSYRQLHTTVELKFTKTYFNIFKFEHNVMDIVYFDDDDAINIFLWIKQTLKDMENSKHTTSVTWDMLLLNTKISSLIDRYNLILGRKVQLIGYESEWNDRQISFNVDYTKDRTFSLFINDVRHSASALFALYGIARHFDDRILTYVD